MKCKDCNHCQEVILTRWSNIDACWVRENVHKCYGVKEPFIINNINVECKEYPEYRNKKPDVKIEDAISHFKYGISHDIFNEPVTSYAKMAVNALEKQIPQKAVCEGDDESDYVYCPCCHKCIGSNEMVWEDFYYREWNPIHCEECGQAIVWK